MLRSKLRSKRLCCWLAEVLPRSPETGYENRTLAGARRGKRDASSAQAAFSGPHPLPPAGAVRRGPTPGNASCYPVIPPQPPLPQPGCRSPAPRGCGSPVHRSSNTTGSSSSTRTPCTPPSSSFTAAPDHLGHPLPPRIRASRDWPREGHVALWSSGSGDREWLRTGGARARVT